MRKHTVLLLLCGTLFLGLVGCGRKLPEEPDLSPATMKPTQEPISYVAENEKNALALPDAKQFGRELQDFIYWEYATEIDKDAHDGMTILTNLEAGNYLDKKLKLHLYYYECDASEMDEEWDWNFYDVVVTFPEESQMSYYTFRYMSKGLSLNYEHGYGVYAEDGEDEEDDISSSELEQKAWFQKKYTFFGETDLTVSKNEAENYEVTSRFEEGEKEQILAAITRAIQKQYGKKKYRDQVVYVRDFLPGDSQLSGRVVDLDMASKNDMPLYWIQSVIYYSDEKREKFEDICWHVRCSTAYSGASQPNYNPTVKQLKEWAEGEKECVDVEKCVLAYQITNGELIDLKEKQNK